MAFHFWIRGTVGWTQLSCKGGFFFAYVCLSAVERRSGSSAVGMLFFLFLLLRVMQLMQSGKLQAVLAFCFGSMSGEETKRSWKSYCDNVLSIMKTNAKTKQTIARKNTKNKQAN